MSRAGDSVAAHLNGQSRERAVHALLRCCAARRWAEALVDARPFADDTTLYETADRLWWRLDPEDWHEAFAAHPRIGDRTVDDWSSAEQAGMHGASRSLAETIRDDNRRYEERFGHVFLICATGLTAEQMAGALRERLHNDPDTELRHAAAEQAKITKLRLQKLVET